MVAEEAPYAGFAGTDFTEIHRTVGLAEAEILVGTGEIPHFAGKTDTIGRIHRFSIGRYVKAQFFIYFPGLGELLDAAGVGVGGYAVVRDAAGHPDGALSAFALADELHNPGFLLVADGEGFSCLIIAIFVHQLIHHGNGFAGRCRSLQGQVHQGEIVQPAFRVAEFPAPAPGSFHDGYLLFIHQAYHGVGVRGLIYVVDLGAGEKAADGYFL